MGAVVPPSEPEYSEAEFSEDGVDLTLIRWMLSLTPAERLEVLQRHVDGILAIRELNAGRQLPGCADRLV